MRFYIRNMVCNRCVTAVERIFQENGAKDIRVELGVADTGQTVLSEELTEKIHSDLINEGFELISDRNSKLIDFIKTLIIKKIHHEDMEDFDSTWSEYLSRMVFHDYKYLSSLFSSVEGITIEQFIILQKIEKIKELIVYDELSLSEIAFRLGYSSIGHLSSQFKKITGMNPSAFRELGPSGRKPIDKL